MLIWVDFTISKDGVGSMGHAVVDHLNMLVSAYRSPSYGCSDRSI